MFLMLSEDCYLFTSFARTFIAVLPELKGLYTLYLVRQSHHSHHIVHFPGSMASGICTSFMQNNEC